MVASAVFITDLTGKPLISRNYRGDIPLTSAIEKFTSYLLEVEDEVKKPVFMVDANGARVGDEEADVTLTADRETFMGLMTGDVNPTTAFMTGKLAEDGDMGKAMALGSALA